MKCILKVQYPDMVIHTASCFQAECIEGQFNPGTWPDSDEPRTVRVVWIDVGVVQRVDDTRRCRVITTAT